MSLRKIKQFFSRRDRVSTPTETLEASEIRRNRVFQLSLNDFQKKFEEEQETQTIGDRARQEEFSRTLAEFSEIFDKNYRCRQELHEKADANQEDRFQKAEAGREAILFQEQKDRIRAFEFEQKLWTERSESCSAKRKELLAEGRKSCIDRLTALDATLEGQFYRLLDKHQQEFLKDNRRRNDFVKENFEKGKKPRLSFASFYLETPLYPHDWQLEKTMPSLNGVDRLPSNQTPPSSEALFNFPSSNSVQPKVSRMSTENQPAGTYPPAPQSDQTTSFTFTEGRMDLGTGASGMGIQYQYNSYDPHLRNEKRQERFLAEEGRRENRFRASEVVREARELEHSTEFSQKMEYWSKVSRQKLELHMDQFNSREQERLHAIERLNAVAESSEKRFSDMFDLSLSYVKQQAKAADAEEGDWIRLKKRNMWMLYEAQRNRLCNASVKRYRWLREQYIDRLAAKEKLPPESYDNSSDYYEPAFDALMEHADNFDPIDILTSSSFIQSELPVPRHKDSKGHDDFFQQWQVQRAEAFERAAQKRHDIFIFNEDKRSDEFMKAQHQRKKRFEQAEAACEISFIEAQHIREIRFRETESDREDTFKQGEINRDLRNRSAQKEREQRFQNLQKELQRKCVEGVDRRLVELEEWGKRLVECREQDQERLFMGERKEFEDALRSLFEHGDAN